MNLNREVLPIGRGNMTPEMKALVESSAEAALDSELMDEEDVPDSDTDEVTASQAAQIIGISRPGIFIHLANGTIPSEKKGPRRMILRSVAEEIADLKKQFGNAWSKEYRRIHGNETESMLAEGETDESVVPSEHDTMVSALTIKAKAEELLESGRFEASAHFYQLFVDQYGF
jgi:hypothetical protein